ncbi:MAG: hypothetical protein LBB88_02030 [Planctomycetaceae bacterium]|nr:hypothetical protein [Planctomycetaceae bacterium]
MLHKYNRSQVSDLSQLLALEFSIRAADLPVGKSAFTLIFHRNSYYQS